MKGPIVNIAGVALRTHRAAMHPEAQPISGPARCRHG